MADQEQGGGGRAPLSLRLGDLEAAVAARRRANESLQAVVRRDLGRYYKVLADTTRDLHLSVEQAQALVWMIDQRFDPAAYRYLWAEVERAAEQDRKVDSDDDYSCLPAEFDERALVEKLKALPAAGSMALLDLIEQYHAQASGDGAEPYTPYHVDVDLLLEVGLVSAAALRSYRRERRGAGRTTARGSGHDPTAPPPAPDWEFPDDAATAEAPRPP